MIAEKFILFYLQFNFVIIKKFKTPLKRSILILFLSISILVDSKAQFNPHTVSFDTILTNTTGEKILYFHNPFGFVLNVDLARTATHNFDIVPSSFFVPPNDSTAVTITFRTNHNLSFKDFLVFNVKEINYPVISFVNGTAKYPGTQYAFTQGLIDEELKSALQSFTSTGYISLGYNAARDAMFEVIDDYGGDTIECIYTGIRIFAQNRTQAQNQGFNTEHVYPQSFFNQIEPMRSDIHHLFPTEANSNNIRGNLKFGVVTGTPNWQQGGSKRGLNAVGQEVFEPRDKFKGDLARCLFYFMVRYNGSNIGSFFDQRMQDVLKEWNRTDTVSTNELLRNNRIQTYQNNRSPFVDHPEFADRIRSFFTTAPTVPAGRISVSRFQYSFDTLAVNDTMSHYFAILNFGTGTLGTLVTSSTSEFIVEEFPAQVPAYDYRFIKVKFKPSAANQTYNGNLTIVNADSVINISLTGYSNSKVGISTITSEIPLAFELSQNYPNPFNPETKIRFALPTAQFTTLKVYNSIGEEVATLTNQKLAAGIYEYNFNAFGLSSGTYFYRLEAGEFSEARRFVLLK